MIKPHLLLENKMGSVLTELQGRLNSDSEICSAQMFSMNKQCTEEFLEVYKGVLPNYSDMISEFCNSPCLALAIRGRPNIVDELREIAGPYDPQIAKHIRTKSLRAIYGKNIVQNGIHVTDLEEDGPLECEYFFDILQES